MIVFENHGPNHGSSSYRDDSAAVHGMLVPSMTVFQFSLQLQRCILCQTAFMIFMPVPIHVPATFLSIQHLYHWRNL